jgi:hypothetical protein
MRAGGWEVDVMGSFNGIAPFLAPLSEGLARGVERVEFSTSSVMPFNLLYCHARLRAQK